MSLMNVAKKMLLLKLGGAGSGGAAPIVYLLRDEFTTDASAPLTSPRTCEPGPGTLVLVQNDGQFSISGEKMVVPAQTTPTWTDLGFYSSPTWPRASGLAFMALMNVSTYYPTLAIGAASVGYDVGNHWMSRSAYGIDGYDGNKLFRSGVDMTLNEEMINTIVLQSVGAYYIINETLHWVGENGSLANVSAKLVNRDGVGTFDYVRVAQLPAPFADDALAIYTDATPVAGDTATSYQDAVHYIQWTPVAVEVFEILFRWIDDDNCFVLRCNQAAGWMRIYSRIGGIETQLGTANMTWTAGTPRRIYLRYADNKIQSGVQDVGLGPYNITNGYNSEQTGCKIAGAATLANWKIYPAVLPADAMNVLMRYADPFAAGARSPQTISVADGGDIAAAIATMKAGDTLSLAPGGSYTLAGGVIGFTALPSGYWGRRTTVQGNGATITGGKVSIALDKKRHVHIENVNLIDATERCLVFTNCRWFSLDNVYAASTAGVALFDVFRFIACRDGEISNCEAGPSTGWGDHDGFECTEHGGDITFTNCIAHGVVHGFEVWTGTAPNGKVYRVTWRNCQSYDNEVGYSSEGGVQSKAHLEIVADGCTASSNSEYDYQGIDGATLYIENDTGGTKNGSVTVRS